MYRKGRALGADLAAVPAPRRAVRRVLLTILGPQSPWGQRRSPQQRPSRAGGGGLLVNELAQANQGSEEEREPMFNEHLLNARPLVFCFIRPCSGDSVSGSVST